MRQSIAQRRVPAARSEEGKLRRLRSPHIGDFGRWPGILFARSWSPLPTSSPKKSKRRSVMHQTQPVSASDLAGHVDQLFANSWHSNCHVGLLPPSTDISGVQLTPIFGPAASTLQSLRAVSAVGACLTALGQGTTIATASEGHAGTSDRRPPDNRSYGGRDSNRAPIDIDGSARDVPNRSSARVRARDWARPSERTREPG